MKNVFFLLLILLSSSNTNAEIWSMTVTDFSITCDNNGTTSDETDDFYNVFINVEADGVSSNQFRARIQGVTMGTFDYGVGGTFNIPADGSTPSEVYIADSANPFYATSADIDFPLDPCSADCEMNITDFEVTCSDNGTLSDLSDDFYTIVINANATNVGASGQFQVNINGNNIGIFDYGTGGSFTLPADDSSPDIIVRDNIDSSCSTILSAGPLEQCSDICTMSIVSITENCNDNGTPSNPLDDFYDIDIRASRDNFDVFSTFEVIVGGVILDTLTFFTGGSISLPADGNSVLVTLNNNGSANCSVTFTTTPLTTCSSSANCTEESIIDFNYPCDSQVYEPVCGCDGVTYDNDCLAYYYWGISYWTQGECNYSNGAIGTGGSTGGISLDPDCNDLVVEFDYVAELNLSNNQYEISFYGISSTAQTFSWDFGNGTTSSQQNSMISLPTGSSPQNHTICLSATRPGANIFSPDCTATVCETIVLTPTSNGGISGNIVEGNNLGNEDEIVLKILESAPGDPIPNVLVELEDISGNVISSTQTDSNGAYSFTDLLMGNYFIHVNVAGVSHTPYTTTLDPIVQARNDVSFIVNSNSIISDNTNISFASDVLLSPNPTQDFVNLSMSITETVDANILVTDILGQTIQTRSVQLNRGREAVRVDLDGLPSGMYMISLQANGETLTKKVLKK